MKEQLINDIIEILHKINNPNHLLFIRSFVLGVSNDKNKNIVSKWRGKTTDFRSVKVIENHQNRQRTGQKGV